MLGCHPDEALEMPIDDVIMQVQAYRLKEVQYRKGWAHALGGDAKGKDKASQFEAAKRKLAEQRNG